MRRRIDSDSFNKEVLNQVNRLKIALTNITPDNVKYFDNNLIRKARGVVNSVDEYKWGGNSTINSVSVKSINRLVDFLKIKKQEYLVLETFANRYEATHIVGETSKTKPLLMNAFFDIPDKFDGRNSFVYYLVTEDLADTGKGDSIVTGKQRMRT